MFCKWALERGHSLAATAEKLNEVSQKAQERMRIKDDARYAALTARNAAAALQRQCRRAPAQQDLGARQWSSAFI